MKRGALKLGVNLDHVATLRQQRGTAYPSVVKAAELCVEAGAHGITVHLREDRRHIQEKDVRDLKKSLTVPLNLEMANAPEIVRIALDVRPADICLVPERRRELTTEGGLDVVRQAARLESTLARMSEAGIRVSLFVAPETGQLDAAARIGAPCVELHTGTYCDAAGAQRAKELRRIVAAARHARRLGLQVNAGHGISLDNVAGILRIPCLDTLNIGHSIVCRAVFVGIERAAAEMLAAMKPYRGGR